MIDPQRYLTVVADDFGIGPATSRGILELAAQGAVTGTVLLVNSPYVHHAIHAWEVAGRSLELGWHPCLTLDRPILHPDEVPSLVRPDGHFWPLGPFMRRLFRKKIKYEEVVAEFQAQYDHFRLWTHTEPTVVNSHHHVHVFPLIGAALRSVLSKQHPAPYLRRIHEPWHTLKTIPGARFKRAVLSHFGERQARHQIDDGFPGNDWLIGITDPNCVNDPSFFRRWLLTIQGRWIELTCHPGEFDTSLNGRDGSLSDGQIHRRATELEHLRHPDFQAVLHEAGFTLAPPSFFANRTSQAVPVEPFALSKAG